MRGTRIRGLMQAMLRVGVIGFGGGNALIPVMEKGVCDEETVRHERRI